MMGSRGEPSLQGSWPPAKGTWTLSPQSLVASELWQPFEVSPQNRARLCAVLGWYGVQRCQQCGVTPLLTAIPQQVPASDCCHIQNCKVDHST